MSWIIIAYLSMLTIFLLGSLFSRKFYSLPETDTVPISIIICARNEAGTIEACLQSLIKQDYAAHLLELIVVDDGSIDNTSALAAAVLQDAPFAYKLLRNETALGKKRSLAKGIAESKHSLIITRDADTYCESKLYLKSVAACNINERADVIIGPIALRHTGGLLSSIQNLENRVLRVIASGSAYFQFPFLSSGANFAFTRAAYESVGGYASHLHIASGDDVFFLQEAAKQKHLHIAFLNSADALVYTYPAATFKTALLQRARWAGKVLKRPTLLALFSGLLILAANLLFIIALVQLFFHPQPEVIQILIFKAGMDFFLLFLAGKGFEKRANLLRILVMVVVYPFYLLISTVFTLFAKPSWK